MPVPDPLHFDAHAEVYERARPPYPAALWSRLSELRVLQAGTRVVELGAGSGQATGPMVAAGATVTAVEPGPALALRLRRRLPDVVVHVAAAESVALPSAAFDLAVAATSLHWFDLDVVLPRLHRALVPSGHFAVWRHAFGDPSAAVTPFRHRVAAITARRGEAAPRSGPDELATASWRRQLTASGHFEAVHVEEFRWTTELSSDQVRDLFTTFSNWTDAEVQEAGRAADELGGRVTEHYVTPLILLRRTGGPDRGPA